MVGLLLQLVSESILFKQSPYIISPGESIFMLWHSHTQSDRIILQNGMV